MTRTLNIQPGRPGGSPVPADRQPGESSVAAADRPGGQHGHAMAMYGAIKPADGPRQSTEEAVAAHFAGRRAGWRETYDRFIASVAEFGSDVSAQPAKSYISLVRAGKRFAIVGVTSERFDVGIKLKGAAPTGRLTPAGSWNAMVTHRVAVKNPGDVDPELIRWLRSAYEGGAA